MGRQSTDDFFANAFVSFSQMTLLFSCFEFLLVALKSNFISIYEVDHYFNSRPENIKDQCRAIIPQSFMRAQA